MVVENKIINLSILNNLKKIFYRNLKTCPLVSITQYIGHEPINVYDFGVTTQNKLCLLFYTQSLNIT
ncbi:MAG TPA: hypothetical protein ENI78_03060 [Euryarchaeota archaeon]|nr:hypothetical protein [Euryarchaeota archaeon]